MDNRTLPGRRCGAAVFGTFVAASATALALFGGTGAANAAGFALKEQSAAAQGNAFAGATAGAEDVSYMFFNPAGLTRLDGHAAAVVLSVILPSADITNATASSVVGPAITGSTADGGVNALVPALYAAYSFSPDLKLGVSITAPFGLTTDYDAGWIGRYHALETGLTTVNINPVVAYRVNERVSVGGGIQLEYADATLSNAIDFGTLSLLSPAADGIAGQNDGSSELTGDDWAFGYNLGFLFELSEATRFGLNYRSEIDHTLEGNVDFDTGGVIGDGVAAALTLGTFTDTSGQAGLALPQSVSAGVFHQINEKWAVMGDVTWTGWSSLDEIRVTFDNGTQGDSVTTTNWDDVWFAALGATWQANDKWTLRGGIAYDQSPIPDATRTPRIPDADRTWLSIGAKYQPRENFTIDAGYTHIIFADSPVSLTATGENTARGNLAFDTDISIDILTVQGTFRF